MLVDTVLTVKKDDDGGSRTFRNYVFFFVVVLVSKVRAYKRAATGNNNKAERELNSPAPDHRAITAESMLWIPSTVVGVS